HHPNSGALRITIYSKDAFDISRDSRRLTEEQLDAKYPALAKTKRQHVEAYQETLERRKRALPEDKRFEAPVAKVRVYSRSSLGTVVHVGADYFIVEDADSQGRSAHSARTISRINWLEEPAIDVSAAIVSTEDAD
ncbi:hypothetical protein, partial [Roseimaritima sediminicola]|uniref:hypothetical protein n=1 Tax=Roseimaritima sediminicola TaxID=2662066 RepID=UPI001F17B68B